ncbi:MAG: hypothetical protein ACTSUE_02700 [Promethearchaeota archaeon]
MPSKAEEPGRESEESEDEKIGVQLPFMRLISAMITIIATGIFPCTVISYLYFWTVNIVPPLLVAKLIWFLTVPVMFWVIYYLYIYVTVLVTKVFLLYFDKQCDIPEGVIQRQFKEKSHPDYRILHYYHMRGAIIKYAIWIAQKSPFPGMLHRILVYFGHNEIGARVIYENCFVGLEFAFIGDDAVVEIGSALSTHVVESLYGSLWIKRITFKDRSVIGINNIIGPGTTLQEENHMGDNCMSFLNWPLVMGEGNKCPFFVGSPAKQNYFKIFFEDGQLKEEYYRLVGDTFDN